MHVAAGYWIYGRTVLATILTVVALCGTILLLNIRSRGGGLASHKKRVLQASLND